MAEVASAYVSLIPSARGFGSKLESEVGGEVNSSGGRLGKSFGKVFAAGAAVIGGAALIGGFLKDSFGEAEEAQKVGAQTNAVIKATGGVAKVSAQQVGDLASAISRKSGIDDEVIQSGENMLLTFKNIRNEAGKGNDIFNQSTQTLTDMSVAMGTEPKQAAIQLGKALNDPIKGIAALSRVGVTFTEGQKKTIQSLVDSGDVMGAQKIILKELNSEFGGSAAAQATASDKMKVAWGNLQEQVGTALMPVMDKFFTFITNTVIPGLADLGPVFSKIGDYIAPVVSAVQNFFGQFSAGGGSSKVAELKATFSSAFASIKDIVKSAVAIVTVLWNSFGSTILSYAKSTFSNILQVVRGAFQIIQGIFKVVSSLLKGDWAGVWDGIKQILSGAWEVIKGIVKQGWNIIKTTFSAMGIVVKGIFGRLWDGIKTLASKAWDGIKNIVTRGIAAQVDLLRALPGKAKGALSSLGSALGGVFTAAFAKVRDIVSDGASRVVDAVRAIPGKLRALGSLFASAGHAIITAFVNGLKGAGGLVSDIAGNVWNAVKGLLNDAIGKINAALSFTIHLPGPDVSINPPDIPYLAKGTNNFRGGLAVVGERGPELVNLPRGSQVIPNSKSMGTLRGVGGGDDATLAELRAIRGALARVGVQVGREINGAVVAGYRGEAFA